MATRRLAERGCMLARPFLKRNSMLCAASAGHGHFSGNVSTTLLSRQAHVFKAQASAGLPVSCNRGFAAAAESGRAAGEDDDDELPVTLVDDPEQMFEKPIKKHVVPPPSLLTSTNDILALRSGDLYKYFEISDKALGLQFKEGVPAPLRDEFAVTSTNRVMLRENAEQLIGHLRRIDRWYLKSGAPKEPTATYEPRRRFYLDGPAGCGKTILLATLVHWARSAGWLVLYVPSPQPWVRGPAQYEKKGGMWDTPALAQTLLRDFLASHGTLLASLPRKITTPMPLGDEGSITGRSLKHLVEHGLARWKSAVPTLMRLTEELGAVTDVPVLVAVDDFNVFFSWSTFYEVYGLNLPGRDRQIHALEFRMVEALRNMEDAKWGDAITLVGASSRTNGVPRAVVTHGVPKDFRYDVTGYTPAEFKAAALYYDGCANREFDEREFLFMKSLAATNCKEFRRLACSGGSMIGEMLKIL